MQSAYCDRSAGGATATHLHPLEIRNGAVDIPVVVLQAIFGELKIETRAEDDILHPSALWLRLQMRVKSARTGFKLITDKVDRFDGRPKLTRGARASCKPEDGKRSPYWTCIGPGFQAS